MKYCILICVTVGLVFVNVGETIVRLSAHSVCRAKVTCERCLQQPQCAWCDARTGGPRCFPTLFSNKIKCDNLLIYKDQGLSLAETAACACSRGNLTSDCMAPGAPADSPACYGRGACLCGRCLCNTMDDPHKMVTGQYCECDNFSCEGVVGKDCAEGPYCLDGTTFVGESDQQY